MMTENLSTLFGAIKERGRDRKMKNGNGAGYYSNVPRKNKNGY